jgi:hypothetical protein
VEIHLLPAGQFEQKVERSLESVHIDAQSRLVLAPLGERGILEG